MPSTASAERGSAPLRPEVVIASFAGDAFAVEEWVDRYMVAGTGQVMLWPRVSAQRMPVVGLPTTLVWRGRRLVDILVGADRFPDP